MRNAIRKLLKTLRSKYGESIFTDPQRFKTVLNSVSVEGNAWKIYYLLSNAICNMRAYSHLEAVFREEKSFIVDTLARDMSSKFSTYFVEAKVVIESIAELLGYVPENTDIDKELVLELPNPEKKLDFKDHRDGNTYRTVKIGNQVWLAENLNYEIEDSWGYYDNGWMYGRLYTWYAARIACPVGWHLPTRQEWNELLETVGGPSVAGRKLKAENGWDKYGNGTDKYKFSALPGGHLNTNGDFYGAGASGYWWTATEYGGYFAKYYAYRQYMDYNYDYVVEHSYDKDNRYSVRCVKDDVC